MLSGLLEVALPPPVEELVGRVIEDIDEEAPLEPAIELIPAAEDWTRDLSVCGHWHGRRSRASLKSHGEEEEEEDEEEGKEEEGLDSIFIIGVSVLINLTSPLATDDDNDDASIIAVVVTVVDSADVDVVTDEELEEEDAGEKMLQSLWT